MAATGVDWQEHCTELGKSDKTFQDPDKSKTKQIQTRTNKQDFNQDNNKWLGYLLRNVLNLSLD